MRLFHKTNNCFFLLGLLLMPFVLVVSANAGNPETNLFVRQTDLQHLPVVSFSGAVTRVSVIPDPQRNDYDDCLYAVEFAVSPSKDFIKPAQIILVAPIMKNKQLIPGNILKPDQKLTVTAVEYDKLPEYMKQIQLSDSIENFEAPMYYVLDFAESSGLPKTDVRSGTVPKIIDLPAPLTPSEADPAAAAARKERIQNELARIDGLLKEHGGSFRSWQKEYYPTIQKIAAWNKEKRAEWINGAFFATPSCFWAVRDEGKPFVRALLPYRDYLRKNNIDLILLRVPSKGELSAAVFLSTEKYTENPFWMEVYKTCLENDIEVVDPLPEMWARYNEFFLSYFYHVPRKSHPFTGTSVIVSDVLSSVLKRYHYRGDTDQFVLAEGGYRAAGNENRYCFPAGNPKYDPGKIMRFPVVLCKATNLPFPANAKIASPFLFCSNSFGVYPDKEQGASIPHYTAQKTGVIPAWFYQNGIGLSILRHCVAKPQILQGRKTLILIMYPNMWYESAPVFPEAIRMNVRQLVQVEELEPRQIQKMVSVKGCQKETAGKLINGDRALSLNHYGPDSEFQFSIDENKEKDHSAHVVRIIFQSHGHLIVQTNNIPIEISVEKTKQTSLDLFFPAECKKFDFSLRRPERIPLIISSIEIYRCK